MVPSTFTAHEAVLQIVDDGGTTLQVTLPLIQSAVGSLGSVVPPPELMLKVKDTVNGAALEFFLAWQNDTLSYYNGGGLAFVGVSPYRKGKLRLFDKKTALVPDECFWFSSLALIELFPCSVPLDKFGLGLVPFEARLLAKDLQGPFMVTDDKPVLVHKDSGIVGFKGGDLDVAPSGYGHYYSNFVDLAGGCTGPTDPLWDTVSPAMKKPPTQLTEKGLETLKRFGVKSA